MERIEKGNEMRKIGAYCCGLFMSIARTCKKCEACFVVSIVFLISSNVYAAICFLPDCHDKPMQFTPQGADECLADGYVSIDDLQCPQYTNIEYCVENTSYIKCDARQWCVDNGYELVECEIPEYLDGQCPNGENLYMYCTEDFMKACSELSADYVLECEDGYTKADGEECPYSDDYGKCCNLCEGYDYLASEIGEGFHLGDACEACGGVTKYKREVNACEGYQSCPDGGKLGAATCMHGTERWYDECCENLCNLDACPEGTDCTYETCSGKYCAVGCLTGYENYCDVPVMDCVALGYTDTSCEGDKMICPYDSGRFLCIQMGDDITKKWCQDNGYTVTSCSIPTYPSEPCPTDPTYYKTCVSDTAKACSEVNSEYVATCPSGYQKDSSDLCSYDNTYGACCNLCNGYDYLLSEIPTGYVTGDSCIACGNITKYQAVINTCEGFQACPNGGETGAAMCQHGSDIWYAECCPHACSLDSCPEGTVCTFEECSGKYCAVGCLTNYIDYCDVPEMNCETLGYTATSCDGAKLICPYDTGKFYCIQLGE